jgi:hypothetical protein
VGVRCAGHATPLYPRKLALKFPDRLRPISRYIRSNLECSDTPPMCVCVCVCVEKEKLVAGPRWWPNTRRDWPTDRRSLDNLNFCITKGVKISCSNFREWTNRTGSSEEGFGVKGNGLPSLMNLGGGGNNIKRVHKETCYHAECIHRVPYPYGGMLLIETIAEEWRLLGCYTVWLL